MASSLRLTTALVALCDELVVLMLIVSIYRCTVIWYVRVARTHVELKCFHRQQG